MIIPPFIRSLKRHNGLVILNVSGLALGLASVIFIAIWISNEINYDRFFSNSDRIYRIESLMNFTGEPFVWTVCPPPVAESVLKDFPEVENAVRLKSGYNTIVKAGDEVYSAKNLYYTDNLYFEVFSTKVISGNRSGLLDGQAEVVVSANTAEVLFGSENPVGKQVLLNNKDLLTVTGIIENSPPNTHLKIDYLISFSVLEKSVPDLDKWGTFNYITYVLLKKNANAEKFNEKLTSYMQSKTEHASSKASLFINPLTRIYLYRNPGFESVVYPSSDRGPITRVILFAFIGGVLLIIACMNFINLSTAFAAERAREIGIRKVNGAKKTNLVIQLFGESVLQTSLSTFAALALVVIMLPVFRKMSGLDINLPDLFSVRNIIIYISLAFITGLIAGIYPALILSSFSPVKVIKPMSEDTIQGYGLRKILVVTQFALSIIFIFCILIMNRQINYMQHKDLGFDKERVMVIYPSGGNEKTDILASEIEKLPGISNIAFGGNVPVNMGNFSTINKWDCNTTGKALRFHMMQVDDRCLDVLDIELVNGRAFIENSTSAEVIINETAVNKMDMQEPLGKSIWSGKTKYTICGIVKDFHFHRLKDEILPVFIYKNKEWWAKRIFVKLEPGDQSQLISKINSLVEENAPGFPPKYVFLDSEVDRYYEGEQKLSFLINAATFISIVISCIGLFSFTAFTVRRRRKETGIRKAYGATASNILFLLQREFSTLILIASVIALPAGHLIIRQWLNSYSYHINLNPLYDIITIVLIVIITAATMIFHTLKAANLNPAVTLRNE